MMKELEAKIADIVEQYSGCGCDTCNGDLMEAILDLPFNGIPIREILIQYAEGKLWKLTGPVEGKPRLVPPPRDCNDFGNRG